MSLRRLRWVTVLLPAVFIIILELVEDFIFEPVFGQIGGHVVTFIIVATGAIAFSFVVFQIIDQTESRLRQQNKDLASLNEISQIVSRSLELDAILEKALEKVLVDLETEAGEIFLVDKKDQNVVLKIHRGLFPDTFGEITQFPFGEGFPGLVAASGESIVSTDLVKDERFLRKGVVAKGIQAMASVPLRAKDQVVGVLNVADRNKEYSDEELSLLTSIGNQIGMAIENAKLFSQVEETLGYLDAVIESSGDAIITTTLDGNIKSWNPAAEIIYGWSFEEAFGQYIPMVPEHARKEAEVIMTKVRKGHTVSNFETERLTKSGNIISIVVTASPVKDSAGNIIGLAGISKDVSERNQLQAEIAHSRQAVAVLEERERIAREMHDGLAQVLGYVNTKAQAVRQFIATDMLDEAKTHLIQLEEAARSVYADVREAILGLRTTVTSDKGFINTLEEYIKIFEQQSGVHTELVIEDPKLPKEIAPSIEVQLIRIIQESLTNVRKHSGAENVVVRFEGTLQDVQIVIEDDGDGFSPMETQQRRRPRFGFQTMRERAESVGGTLEIKSTPGDGTNIRVILPSTEVLEQ